MSVPSPTAEAPPRAARPLLVAAGVTALVAVLSRALPHDWAGTAVGLAFLVATWALVLAPGHGEAARSHGLSLGGLFDADALDAKRVARESLLALALATVCALVFFPPFFVGFRLWFGVARPFDLGRALPWGALADEAGGQLLAVALPEEAFYRGYLQTELDRAFPPRLRVLGARVGMGLVVTSAVFAVGHLLTVPAPARLAVFFPALVFGWLRARTGGVGAGVVFHAACNLFSATLARGFGLG